MEKEGYEKLFKQSWIDLKNNLVMFIPNIFMFVSTLVLVFIFFTTTGLVSYLQHQPVFFREYPIADIFTKAPIKILLLFIAYVVIEFILAAFISTMKYGMSKEIAEKGKTTLKAGFHYGKAFFFKVLRLELLILAIIFGPLLIYFVISSIATSTDNITGTFFLVIFIILLVIYFIYVVFHILFVYPVLFFEKKHTIITIKKEFHYVKTHFIHTVISWLLIIGIFLTFYIAKLPFDKIVGFSSSLIIILIAFLLIYILEIIVSNWEHIFVMKAYLLGKKENLEKKPKE